MKINWTQLKERAELFDAALNPLSPLTTPWQVSRRFPELTYIREDLTGGYKGRKYASLVPWMVAQGFRSVNLKGSSHSSNICQLSLLLKQKGIRPRYLLEGREGPLRGNGLMSRLILGADFLEHADDVVSDWEVPEGASCPPALRGSLGLVRSLVAQMIERRTVPHHIYIDSGTGFTATALIMGLGFFELPVSVSVVSMTRQEPWEIEQLLKASSQEYQRLFAAEPRPRPFTLSLPPVGRSFGSTPTQVLEEVRDFAREESILTDPLYTAKLSLAYQERRDPERSTLMFVSGGARELLGFQDRLSKVL